MNGFVENFLDRVAEYMNFFFGPGGNIGALIAVVIMMLIWLGSGALSSSVAERKMRGGILHFFAGLLIPVLYPLAAMVIMRPPERWRNDEEEDQEDDLSRIDGPPPVVTSARGGNKGGRSPLHEDTLGTQSSVYDQAYFKGIMFDDIGRSRGPFNLIVEGVELRVERIADAMPEVAVVETLNADGKQQTLRIPYEKVEYCREI